MHNLLKIGPIFGGGFGKKTLSVESVVEGILAYMNIDKHIWVDYDKEADVLYLSFRKPQRAKKTVETDDDVLIRTDGDQIVGITIMNASSR